MSPLRRSSELRPLDRRSSHALQLTCADGIAKVGCILGNSFHGPGRMAETRPGVSPFKSNADEVDANLLKAVDIAVQVMPYRHHRLAAIKLDKDPVMGELNENASLAELEAEMKKHLLRLAPVLDLTALMAPADGTANQEVPQGTGNGAGGPDD